MLRQALALCLQMDKEKMIESSEFYKHEMEPDSEEEEEDEESNIINPSNREPIRLKKAFRDLEVCPSAAD